jgi:hypothetical protein
MMQDMPNPKHANPDSLPEPAGKGGVLAAWLVLVMMGGTSVTFNVWHAVHSGRMLLPLALLAAVAPVFAAMGLSHIVATHKCGWFMKAITVGVMLGAMALSAGAIAAVIAPVSMHLSWLFGGVLDAAALIALGVILTEHGREAARQAAHDAAAAEAARRATEDAAARTAEVPAAVPPQEPAQVPRRTASRASRDPEAEKARTAYRKSVRASEPLSDRTLGEMFGRSRTWGANRIREVDNGSLKLAQ